MEWAELLNEGAALLEEYKPEIEAATGPIVLNVVNGAVKIADGVFNKLPLGLGALLDAALAGDRSPGSTNPTFRPYEGQETSTLVQRAAEEVYRHRALVCPPPLPPTGTPNGVLDETKRTVLTRGFPCPSTRPRTF